MKKCLALVMSMLLLATLLPLALPASAAITASVSAEWRDGTLKFTWDAASTTGYTAKMAKIDENESAISVGQAGVATATVAHDCSKATIQLGFDSDTDADEQVDEWVTVSNLRCYFAVEINAYKANNNLNITVLDEFDNAVPAGQNLNITLTFADNSTFPLLSQTAAGGTLQTSLSNYNNLAKASISIAEFTVGNVTYLAKTIEADMSVQDQTVYTQMKLKVKNGKIVAIVTDDAGQPMKGVSVVLDFGSTVDYDTQITDANGEAAFEVAASSKAKIVCRVGDWSDKHITYKGCTASYGGTTNTTTQTKRPTTTTTTTTTTTGNQGNTTTTFDVIIGAGTTAYPSEYEDYVAVDATFDSGVLEVFGVKESEFANRAQLLIKREEYDRWIGEDAVALMLSVRFSNVQVTDDQIQNVIKDDYDLMSFTPDQISHVSAALSAQLLTADGELVTLMLDNSEYIVRLPIPKSMKDATLIMVAQQLDGAISTPVGTALKNGYFEFTTANLAELTFLGFVENTEVDNHYFVFTIIFVAIGVLLLVGAGLILYFFVIRKPKNDVADADDTMTDLYSNDMPLEGEVAENGDILIAPMEGEIDLPPQRTDLFENGVIIPDFSEDND